MRCAKCGQEMTRRLGSHHFLASGLDNVYLEGVPIWECPCGEREVELARGSERLRELGKMLIQKPSPLTGAEVRFLRKRMRLAAQELAAMMGVSNVTVSRWEAGKSPINPSNDRLLRLLFAGFAGLRTKELAERVFPGMEERPPAGRTEPWRLAVGT